MEFFDTCRHFRTDRPCLFHKRDGRDCPGCPDFDPKRERILIVKLGAMGDVLRTTAILPPLSAAHPGAAIWWLVAPESVELLDNNPFLDRILPLGVESLVQLDAIRFDLVINLDLAPESLALASRAQGKRKLGYGMNPDGSVRIFNSEALPWYEISHHDRLKRENTRTCQDHMLGILGLSNENSRIIVNCPESEREYTRSKLIEAAPQVGKGPVVGLNFGAGGRWQLKKWTREGFARIARDLYKNQNATIVLLYGARETEEKEALVSEAGIPMVDAGGKNSLSRFAAWISLCDVVVTGDTMALHMALGLGRRVVALFGPTSLVEIEMYGLGTKRASEVDCLCCYRETCGRSPSCMEALSHAVVYDSVLSELKAAGFLP